MRIPFSVGHIRTGFFFLLRRKLIPLYPTCYKTHFMKQILLVWMLLIAFAGITQEKTNPENQSEELGNVTWYRDYDQALKLASKEDKQVLILFQEVPGCMTCRNYGHNVLTHPLMVEAIENLFVPLAIYNNKGGKDKVVLEKYGEPSWNNPVVRIVNSAGKDVVSRISGNYSVTALIASMQQALKSRKGNIPIYLDLTQQEMTAKKNASSKTAYFSMYCFWSGEKHFGNLPGVLDTESGFIQHKEVVKVVYDSNKLSTKALNNHAIQGECRPIEDKGTYKKSTKDDKYYLQQTCYKYLPLTNLQQVKINAALGRGESAKKYLSPQQWEWFLAIKSGKLEKKIRFNKPFVETWQEMH